MVRFDTLNLSDKLKQTQQRLISEIFYSSLFVNEEKTKTSEPYIPHIIWITLFVKVTQLQLLFDGFK